MRGLRVTRRTVVLCSSPWLQLLRQEALASIHKAVPPPPPPPRCYFPCRPRTATVASRQHGCLHPTVSTMGAGINQGCRALVSKRACKW